MERYVIVVYFISVAEREEIKDIVNEYRAKILFEHRTHFSIELKTSMYDELFNMAYRLGKLRQRIESQIEKKEV